MSYERGMTYDTIERHIVGILRERRTDQLAAELIKYPELAILCDAGERDGVYTGGPVHIKELIW